MACVRDERIQRGIVESMTPQDESARAWNAQRANGVPDSDEIGKRKAAGVHRKAAVALAIVCTEGNALPLLFIVPIVLVDLLDRLLDKRQSAFLVLTVTGTVSPRVALRDAA